MKRIISYMLLVYFLSYTLYAVWANTLPGIIVLSDVFIYIFHHPDDVMILISCFVTATTVCFMIIEKTLKILVINNRMAIIVSLIFFVFLMIVGIPWKQPPVPHLLSIDYEQNLVGKRPLLRHSTPQSSPKNLFVILWNNLGCEQKSPHSSIKMLTILLVPTLPASVSRKIKQKPDCTASQKFL